MARRMGASSITRIFSDASGVDRQALGMADCAMHTNLAAAQHATRACGFRRRAFRERMASSRCREKRQRVHTQEAERNSDRAQHADAHEGEVRLAPACRGPAGDYPRCVARMRTAKAPNTPANSQSMA